MKRKLPSYPKLNFKSAAKSKGIFAFLIILTMTFSSYAQTNGITFDCGGNLVEFGVPDGTTNGFASWSSSITPIGTFSLFVQPATGSFPETWEVYGPDGNNVIRYFYSDKFLNDLPTCDIDNWETDPGILAICELSSISCQPTPTWYEDFDNDSYGNLNVSVVAANKPTGYVADNTDCDDTDNAVNPGVTEIPHNTIDDDCDPSTPDNDGSNVYVYCNDAETKVLVCHNGLDKCVSINAVDGHIGHGDTLGSCASPLADNQEEAEDNQDLTKGDPTTIDVAYWPNPSKDVFNLKMITPNFEANIDLQVFDINGRLVHANVIGANKNYQFGDNLSNGVYFAKLTQAGTSKVLKVIKH